MTDNAETLPLASENGQNSQVAPQGQQGVPSTSVTPAQMLQIAVERGADPDNLEKLMNLHERWEAREAEKAFVQAMNRFRANPPRLTKNHEVDYSTKQGGRTHYSHATLDHACEVIGAALAEVGISYRWRTSQLDNGAVQVTCILTHKDGHSEQTPLQAMPDTSGGKNSIQAVGSAVTYLERYTLLAATGMAAEDQDDDGQSASAAGVQQGQAQGRTQTQPQDDPSQKAISEQQAQSLLRQAGKAGYDEKAVLQMAGISDVRELTVERWQKARDFFKRQQQQGASQ